MWPWCSWHVESGITECTDEAGEVAVAILLFSHTSSAEMRGTPSSQTGVGIGKRTMYRIALPQY